ncbi:unnamed protein product [Cyclocybe aegerita]|uniref:OPT oligopeptide transporter n=1 Tax=Cyclocybe aegerita TaxID=1973307 RepID=A0A8S0VXS6_CYCAE|nr:unnamed protein product [Cyclocybe aegerita]
MAESTPQSTPRQDNSPSPDVEKGYQDEPKILNESEIAELTGAQFDDPNLDKEHIVSFDDESPYPEVRSAVANTDDFHMPQMTLRVWVIGIAAAIVIPGLNQFFFFRFPSITISGIVAQLVSFPIGRAFAAWLPNWKIFGVSINPGPFTVKEHVLITIMASVVRIYNFSYQWFVVMSTQLIGFSIGGVARRFLVAPPSMIWPANLVNCALFNTLHSQQYAGIGNRGGLSRERFFVYAFTGAFISSQDIFALSYFSWVTWIRPENTTISQLFGYVHGMGMSVITFDWSQIAYIGSPLATPWWAEANIFAGFVFFFWFLTPVLHFTNTWFGEYMPYASPISYDNQAKTYDVNRILTPDSTFDLAAYKAYSPLFLSTTFAISYGLSFASITATLMHAFLYFRKQIWVQARRSLHEQPDIHARLMSKYLQVPEWWYLTIFLSMFTIGIISIEVWPTEMPVWAFVLALLIVILSDQERAAFTYVIPIGMIQAITNQQVGLNVITELIIGYSDSKLTNVQTMAQALTFTSDFKLGHYMKIAPRPMFWCQVVATVVAGTVQLGVQAWMFTNIPDMCSPDQRDGFICPSTEVFGAASIIVRLSSSDSAGFSISNATLCSGGSSGQLFSSQRDRRTSEVSAPGWSLVGAIAPVIPWALGKRYPNSLLKYINDSTAEPAVSTPVIFNGTGLIPPATAVNYIPWAGVGFIFQYLIRRRHFSWWTKYNSVNPEAEDVLSAALDSGLAISILVIFFALQFPKNGTIGETSILNWWGNTVPFVGADFAGTPVRPLEPGNKFGPTTW